MEYKISETKTIFLQAFIMIALLVGISFLLQGCAEKNKFTIEPENGISNINSFNKWLKLKEQNGESYIYKTKHVSWTGLEFTTEIKVENGVVTKRAYQQSSRNANGDVEIMDSYSETEKDLGTHEQGDNALTMDELYNTCAKEYLIVDDQNNTIYFETGESGIMNLCGFVPHGCMDDCFTGIRIDSFEWLNKN